MFPPRLNDATAHGAKVCVVACESDANIHGVRRQAQREAASGEAAGRVLSIESIQSGVALRLPPHSIFFR